MVIKDLFRFKKREDIVPNVDDVLLQAILGSDAVDVSKVMNIPAIAQAVHLISETVSMIPIKLYSEEFVDEKKKTVEVMVDNAAPKNLSRVSLLNDDTKDTLDGVQFKRALVRDYLLYGSAYAYINKKANKILSVNYVPKRNISIMKNSDPIFKDYNIMVQGMQYKPFDFLKILRSTEDGMTGKGIIEENVELLNVAYATILFEKALVATGGNKKGFINAKNKLSLDAMSALKTAWRNLYSNNQENVIVLNDGLTFQEASNTSVEMQLNESKESMHNSICRIFGIPIDGNYEMFIKQAVMPILNAIECALNRDFLLEKEKSRLYFAFDTKEIIKGDIKTRFEAYKTALDCNLMQIDECRYMEDLEPLGLNFIKLGLQDVLYNPFTKEVFTPNTGQSANIGDDLTSEGGEKNENRD